MSQVRDRQQPARSRALTARDVEILRWIARVRFATSEHVALRFELHPSKAYRRLALLGKLGLIARVNLLHNQPGAHHVTRAGMRMLGIEAMPVPTISLQSFMHDDAVVWEQINLETSGVEVLTEREMRHAERTLGTDYLVRIPPHASTGTSTHRPDLVFHIGRQSSLHAVEVELAAKSEARLAAILTGYLSTDTYAAVVYCVSNANLTERVRRIGTQVGLGDRLKIVVARQRLAA